MGEAIGVIGGTFDPIHLGHLAAAQEASYALSLDRVFFVPNRSPPHKQDRAVSPVEDRLAMVALAIGGNTVFELSTIELEREGPSYTLDTMRELRKRLGEETSLSFLTGCDNLASLHTWYEPEKLLEEFELVLLERPGAPADWEEAERHFPNIRRESRAIRIPQLEISSSDIRARVAEGRPMRYYVPEGVAEYIEARGLYRGASSS